MKPILLVAAIVLACAVTPPAAAQPCMPQEAVPAEVLRAPLLVFGEVHGTREVPAFVAAYLCAASRSGRPVTLAMELPVAEQGAIDTFLDSQGTPPDLERFTQGALWRRPMQDGRSSAAMLGLFEDIRRLRAGGADIRIATIDADAPSRQREAQIAANLRTVLDAGAGRQVLALVGGLHAIRSKGKRNDPQYESAIYLLAERQPLVLTVGTAGGSAWICRGPTPASCGAAAWDINRVSPAPGGPFSLTPPSEQFDGVFYVGATTASPPAR